MPLPLLATLSVGLIVHVRLLVLARRQLADSIAAITAALAAPEAADSTGAKKSSGQRSGQYVRAASLFAHIADILPEQGPTSRPQLALRDLELLDGALAEAAHWAGLTVTDLDTAQPATVPVGITSR